ncbi:hypothetical protein GWK47_011944 [Chionoecetes opilio]|uniref:Reverse transcriptase n=1 Tax=Chionoecetes opilio TaxID=41210 RepID=A0A8J5CM35_CHIOP|nr:hypothetical protein GWK47_011944 [Chionoecetes opilio]
MALSEVNITPLPLPLSTAKRLISKVCHSAWDRSLGDALRATSMGQYRTDSSPHPWIRQTSRVLDVALTRLRIGHTTLRAHLHRLQLTPDPYCPWAGSQQQRNVPESIEHFLLQCPRFHSHRQLLRGQLIALNVTFDLPTLLAATAVHPSRRPAVIRLTCAFLRKKTNQLSRLQEQNVRAARGSRVLTVTTVAGAEVRVQAGAEVRVEAERWTWWRLGAARISLPDLTARRTL